VRFRHHKSRKHGIQLDKYFTVRYQRDGKRVEEPLGWASEGWTEQKAALELAKLKSAATTGQGPARLSEKRLIKKREIARIEAEGLTLADFWENDYLHHLKNRLPKESSRQKEIGHFEKRIMPAMGRKPLKEIVPEDAERMLDRMQADGLTSRTQQYALGTLYRIWKHAARRKLSRLMITRLQGFILTRPTTRGREKSDLKN
jgi:hypothetical protein